MATKAGPNIITDGLVLNIDFSNKKSYIGSGTSCVDLKGDAVGTLTNGPVFSNVQNGVMSFDGSDDYITLPLVTNATSNISMSTWIKCNNVNQAGQMIFYNGSDSVGNGYGFSINNETTTNGRFLILYGNVYWNDTGYTAVSNVWYHCHMNILSNGVPEFYINGNKVYTGTSRTRYTPTLKTEIGRNDYNAARYFNGNISDVKFYSKSLSSDEVQKNYTATRKRFVETPKTIPGLQLWLDGADLSTMRQNSNGTTAVALNSDPVGYWGDKSGNGRNAIQATTGNRPTYSLSIQNRIGGVVTNGSSQWMDGSWALFDPLTIFVVFKHVSGTSGSRIFTQSDSTYWDSQVVTGSTYWLPLAMNSGPLVVSYNTTNIAVASVSVTSNATAILQHTRSGLNLTNQKDNGSIATATLAEAITRVFTTYTLGRVANLSAGYVAGQFFEVVAYNRILNGDEYNAVRNYLNQKWAIF